MKFKVNLRIETNSGVIADIYTVSAGNIKAAENIAAAKAMDRLGRNNVTEIAVQEVTRCA